MNIYIAYLLPVVAQILHAYVQACFTAAIEAGIQHFVFDLADGSDLAAQWETLAAIPTTLWLESDSDAAEIWDGQGQDRVSISFGVLT